jgi:DNA-binding transcriptional regulator YdaS (Cro superfamily)
MDQITSRKKLRLSKYMKRELPTHRDEVMQMIYSRAGFAAAVAKHLGVSPQTISAWRRVPAHHVLDLAPLLEMTPEQIRPDVFGKRRA